MTETDNTKRPLNMPERFLPYLEKYRLYKIFKDMVRDLVLNLPKDHLKHMKIFLGRLLHSTKDADRIILLAEPELPIDIHAIAKQLIKDLGCFVITRRCVMDRYENHDNYVPGCISAALMSEVTKSLTIKDPVLQAGWLMFDHPCTVREARCLQQDGVLPTVTLVLMRTPTQAAPEVSNLTPSRNFFEQDFEGLKYAYKATLKEVHIDSEEDGASIVEKCINAVIAHASGAQGPKQGLHVVGAPGVYRVLLLGPRGSGRRTQASALAKHFGLVYLNFEEIFEEASLKMDELGEKIRKFGTSIRLRKEVIQRRIMEKDCLENGWVLTCYHICGRDFESLESTDTPPNRIIFLNVEIETCRKRIREGVDWCTGEIAQIGSGPRVLTHPHYSNAELEQQWETYFTETLPELRAAAGITGVEIDANLSSDEVQVKIQAAVIAAPAFSLEYSSQLRNVCAD